MAQVDSSVIGNVHSTESFGSVDGPGIRFVSFMQGCRLRCQFCHNPDTWKINGGSQYTPQELFDEAIKYRAFWGQKGGVTASGGEPLLQIDFLIEYFKLCKKAGIHTTVDTCGQPFTYEEPFFSKFQELIQYVDLFLFDIKHIDPLGHQELTSVKNDNIMQMSRFLDENDKKVWIRHVLVPQRTDYDEYLIRLGDYVETLTNVRKFEVLPYHKMGIYKYKEMGIPYPLEGIEAPTDDRIANANRLLRTAQYQGYKED